MVRDINSVLTIFLPEKMCFGKKNYLCNLQNASEAKTDKPPTAHHKMSNPAYCANCAPPIGPSVCAADQAIE
jgi:hypothetical protein